MSLAECGDGEQLRGGDDTLAAAAVDPRLEHTTMIPWRLPSGIGVGYCLGSVWAADCAADIYGSVA
jgi:hypothetical protein